MTQFEWEKHEKVDPVNTEKARQLMLISGHLSCLNWFVVVIYLAKHW